MVGGTPAFSTTKTGRHDIAEILLKVALNTINQIKSCCLYFVHKELVLLYSTYTGLWWHSLRSILIF
jgi:hypothetical protein